MNFMRVFYSIVVLALSLAYGATFAISQENSTVVPGVNANSSSPDQDVKYGGAGPIEIWLTDRFYSSLLSFWPDKVSVNGGAKYMLHNVGEAPIRAYALVVVDGEDKRVIVAVYSNQQIDAGTEFPAGYLMRKSAVPTFEPDYVLFTDGKSWGPDSYGRSAVIENYFKGREIAIRRAAELMPEESTDSAWITIKGPYARSWAAELPSSPGDARTQFMSGYSEVVDNLSRGDDALKQIAQKLRAMEPARHAQ
jgi:hypothetical protein